MTLPAAVRRVAKAGLPSGESIRVLPLGIGRGLRLGLNFHSGQLGLYLGLYEIELNRHLRRLCRPGMPCFDIGGQIGYDALVLAKLTGAKVVSVECEPHCCDAIRRNVALNPHLSTQVSVRHAFIDETDDKRTNRLTLDTLADDTFLPGFIKIDIEGGELASLRGASRVLSTMPRLLIEVHSAPLETACIEILRSVGYGVVVVDHRTWLPDYRPAEHNRWIIAKA